MLVQIAKDSFQNNCSRESVRLVLYSDAILLLTHIIITQVVKISRVKNYNNYDVLGKNYAITPVVKSDFKCVIHQSKNLNIVINFEFIF